jgi:hypothetical protein
MPFVQRDSEGRIIAWTDVQSDLFPEWVEPDDPEFLAVSGIRLVVELPDPTSVEERLRRLEQQVVDLNAPPETLSVTMRRAEHDGTVTET